MSTFQIIALVGIGAAVGALTYYNFFRTAKISEKKASESMLEIAVPALPKAFGGNEEKIQRPVQKEKSGTPLNAVCVDCEKTVSLPFRCRFCSELFCGEHRLPESHNCEAL